MAIDPRSAGGDEASPEQFARLETLFDSVVDLEGEARANALVEAGRAHPDLHADLLALLAAHDRLSGQGDAVEPHSTITEGTRIGGYCVLDRLGEGGMGEVFRAERADGVFAGQVAIKTTHASLGVDLLRRFRVERQILALLRHPNIVTLLDGGATESGQAYLIMEHVQGVPLTQYCRTRQLPLNARLKIVCAVADGVQHAHQHGVVHRDLKPANVLVGEDGVPKILDFGVAKLLHDPAGSGMTTRGVTPGPLTPNYASPEQLRGLPVTTASDIYALGVMLYELVAGVRPYETEGQTLDRVLDIVVHTEPQRPSTHKAHEDGRPYSPRVLRGDIDAIVMKAMHKDPVRRYGSAAELAADLTRFLAGDPIVARAPSAGYVLKRVAARHKTLIAMMCVGIVAVVAAMGVALWQRQLARQAQARAEQRFREVRHLTNTLIFKIHDAVTPLPGSTPVRRTIVEEAIGYLERLEAESAGDVALQLELAAAYRQLGSILGDPGRANLGDRAGALKLYERSMALVTPLAHDRADGDVFTALVDGHAAMATIHLQLGTRERAIGLSRESLAYARRFEASRPRDPRAGPTIARACFMLAAMLPPPEARPVWEEAFERYGRLLAANPADVQAQRNVALVGKYLGTLLENGGEFALAKTHYDRALELDQKRLLAAPNDQRVQFDAAISFAASASIAEKLHDDDTAATYFEHSLTLRRRLAATDPSNMQARHRLGYLLARMAAHSRKQGKVAPMREYARESIAVLELVLAATGDRQTGLDLGYAWLQAARAADDAGDRAASCAAFKQAERRFDLPADVLATHNQLLYLEEVKEGIAGCAAGRAG